MFIRLITIMIFLLNANISSAQTAFQMRDYCEPIIEDSTFLSDQLVTIPTTFDAGRCWGGFSAIQGLLSIGFVGEEQLALNVCLPEASTRVQIIEIFYLYTHNNPNILHEDWSYIAWRSLLDSFPC